MAKRASRFGSNVTADIERRKREGSSYGYLKLPQGVNIYKESAGKLKMDIIPYIVSDPHHLDGNEKYPDAANPGNPWYKKPFYVHRSVGAENQSIVCPKTQGKKCPICEQRAKQQSQGVEKGDLVDKAQLRNLYIVIPIGHKEYEEKFHIWDISNGNFQKKLDEELSENPDAGVFPDPSDGKTLSVRFTEETFNKNKYFEASRIDFEDRDGYEDEVMEKAPNLDEVLTILSYKEIEKLFLELGDDEQEEEEDKKSHKKEEEEEEQPFRKKKTVPDTVVKKKAAPVETEEEEEEEEEEEQPVKRKKAVSESESSFKRKPSKTPEPEEEEEEEEEEAPAPIRKKKVEEPAPKRKSSAEPAAGKCPSNHVFGKDWDEYDDCDDCPVFKACGAAHKK